MQKGLPSHLWPGWNLQQQSSPLLASFCAGSLKIAFVSSIIFRLEHSKFSPSCWILHQIRTAVRNWNCNPFSQAGLYQGPPQSTNQIFTEATPSRNIKKNTQLILTRSNSAWPEHHLFWPSHIARLIHIKNTYYLESTHSHIIFKISIIEYSLHFALPFTLFKALWNSVGLGKCYLVSSIQHSFSQDKVPPIAPN